MRKILYSIFILSVLISGASAQTTDPRVGTNPDPDKAQIVTSDIALFWRAYDMAKPENNLNVFRDEYFRKGSAGLEEFRKLRISSACGLVDVIEKHPKYYAALREPSLKVESYKPAIQENFRRLKNLYADAVFPNVYFIVGRMSSAGTLNEKGLYIGVDMFGKNDGAPLEELGEWHKAVTAPIDRLPFIVTHEAIHFQQRYTGESNTLLSQSIVEGAADFVGELVAGKNINPHLHEYGKTREKELWLEFKKEMLGANRDNWLYQGDKAKNRPADLGYYIGYKICEAYYKRAADKKQAVKDILEVRDYAKFLQASGYDEKFAAGGK